MKQILLIVFIASLYLVSCSKAENNREEALLLNNYAMSLSMRDKMDSAVIVQKLAIEKDSLDFHLWANYSTLLVKQRDFVQALYAMKSALRVKPDFAEAASWIGMYYDHVSDTLNSKLYLDSALSLHNKRVTIRDSCDTRGNRAFALLWTGNISQARIDI